MLGHSRSHARAGLTLPLSIIKVSLNLKVAAPRARVGRKLAGSLAPINGAGRFAEIMSNHPKTTPGALQALTGACGEG